MRRVAIIGGNGSGKTTFARQLAQRTGLPLVHLDRLYWAEEWTPRAADEFDRLLAAELEKPMWIMDGNIRRTLPERLPHCDTIFYFDFPAIACFWGAFQRIWKNRGRSRPDMGGHCVERFDRKAWKFLLSTLSFNRKNRPFYREALARCPDTKVIVFKSRRQARRWMESAQLPAPKEAGGE